VSVIVDLRFTRRETKGWTVGLKVAKIATQRPTAWTIAMLDFNDFFYFVQVVDRGGFTAAGRTLRIPKSTLSHRIQQLEANLGVRLLNRTSRRFGMTDAGEEFYRHAVLMLREAELAETAIRHRLNEPKGTVRCTAAVATMQFAMRDIVPDFLLRYPKVHVVAHATDQECRYRRRELRHCDQSPFRPTSGFDAGATDADTGAATSGLADDAIAHQEHRARADGALQAAARVTDRHRNAMQISPQPHSDRKRDVPRHPPA
jgi:DNA-binding transcriptional LysR family regulator